MFKDSKAFSSFSVKDIAAAKEFYGDKLGLQVEETPEGLQLHIAGGAEILVYSSPSNPPAAFTILNFMVDDIATAVDGLIEKGIVMEQYDMPQMKTDEKGIVRSPESVPGPRAIAWFKDPNGNIIGVIQEK